VGTVAVHRINDNISPYGTTSNFNFVYAAYSRNAEEKPALKGILLSELPEMAREYQSEI
jgi:hypothetical protein